MIWRWWLLLMAPWVWAQAPTGQEASSFDRAFEMLSAGDAAGALSLLDQAVAARPAWAQGYFLRASVHFQLGDAAAAERDLDKALELEPKTSEAYLLRARLALEAGRIDAAQSDLARLQEQIPGDRRGLTLQAVIDYVKGESKASLDLCERLLKTDPRDPRVHCLRGLIMLSQGDVAAALADLNLALVLNAAFPLAYYYRAECHRRLGDEERAADDRHMACALHGDFCEFASATSGAIARHMLQAAPAPGDWVCACCTLYNDRGVHMEHRVRETNAQRLREARAVSPQYRVFHDFTFTDRYVESGIRFVHRITADSGRNWKPVHYDHGNGVAVADVDGDDRLDIYFVSQRGRNELWRNRGDGTFEDITERAGVGLADRIGVTASFADIDNDGDADLFVTTVRHGNALLENGGDGRFIDITQAAGLAYSGHSSGAVFFDFNNDGLLDLFLTNVGNYTFDEKGPGGFFLGRKDAFAGHLSPKRFESSILYRNLGGRRFRDVSAEMGLIDKGWSGDATFADLNGDRFPDLYVLNMQGDDRYYQNEAGRRFADKSGTFAKTPWGAMGVKFFDYNNDGRADLYLTDMHSDMSQKVGPGKERDKAAMVWSDAFLEGGDNNIFGNAFYENRGEGKFKERSDILGLENYWPWGFSVGDLNADGFLDIFVASSMNYPFRYGTNAVFINNQGEHFLDAAFLLGVEPRPHSVKPWFTLDCSGIDAESPHCRGRKGRVAVWGAYGSRASVLFDYDGDGDLDIVTNEFNGEPLVLTSDLAARHPLHYVEIVLRGTRSNRDGLGATVQITAGGKTLTRFVDGKSGYLSQSRQPLYVGLGETQRIDRIEVRWPSGSDQRLDGPLTVNRRLVLEEPRSEP